MQEKFLSRAQSAIEQKDPDERAIFFFFSCKTPDSRIGLQFMGLAWLLLSSL